MSSFNQATGAEDTFYNPSSNSPASGPHGPAEEDTAQNNAIHALEVSVVADYAQLQSQAAQISTLQSQVGALNSEVVNLQGATSTPTEVAPPIVTGSYLVGATLQCSQGTWTGGPGITFQWLRNGSNITSATSPSYTIQSVDITDIITCKVTATNSIGSATYTTSNSTAVSASTPPTLTAYSPPTTMTVGVAVNYQFAASGTTPITFSSTGQLPSGLSLQSGGLLSGTPTLAGTVSFTVTATGIGTPAVSPTITIVVSVVAPANTGVPVVSGSLVVGQTLTTTYGTWNNSPQTYAIVWKSNSVVIANANATTYVLQTSDVGNNITSTVTATNSGGSTSSTSAAVGPVVAGVVKPVNSVAPTISGSFIVADTVTAAVGTWSGSPSYTYQWFHAGVTIAGATGSYYVLAVGDQGDTITVTVTATNTAGSTSATSAAYGPVTAAVSPPTNSVPPQINGNLYVGNVLTATTGSWAGSPGYTYQWQVTPAGGSLTNIPNATTSTYTVASAYSGATIDVVVTGTNSAGSATATSAAVTISTITAPVNLTLPILSTSSPVVGQAISVTNGTWQGQATAALPDMTVTALTLSTTTPAVGQAITFSAVVNNVGTGATPAGVVTGVSFTAPSTPGGTANQVAYADQYSTSIASGSSVTLASDSGQSWTPTAAGTYIITAIVNNTNRYTEASTTNNSFSISVTVANPKLITLVDPFTSSATLATTWSASTTAATAPVPTISGGVATLTYNTGYPSLVAGIPYDLTSSSITAQIGVNTGSTGNQATIALVADASNHVFMQVNGISLSTSINNAGTTTYGAYPAYNATSMKYWRIVNTSGSTILFETSPDKTTWTTQNTVTVTFPLTALTVEFQAGSASGTPVGAMTIQSLNV
jgi:hypothetical protein